MKATHVYMSVVPVNADGELEDRRARYRGQVQEGDENDPAAFKRLMEQRGYRVLLSPEFLGAEVQL